MPGTSMTPFFVVPGEMTEEHLGSTVSSAGDINGDGYADIVVGTPNASSNAGGAKVFLGDPKTMSQNPALSLPGATGGDFFGASVSSAGDVDGDGFADIIIGAYGSGNSTGQAQVFLGSPAPLSNVVGKLLQGAASGDRFGFSVAGAGDIDKNGCADVIVGALYASGTAGVAQVFFGSPASPLSTSHTLQGTSVVGDFFGGAVASADSVPPPGPPPGEPPPAARCLPALFLAPAPLRRWT
jgi:hypothetical protein